MTTVPPDMSPNEIRASLQASGLAPDERRCVRVKKNGERCLRWAIRGTTVCRNHGGTAPHIQRAIAKRKVKSQALAYASRMMQHTGVDMDPAEHLVSALYEAHGMKAFFGAFCARLDEKSQEDMKGGIRGALQYSLPQDELDELSVGTNELLLGFNRHGEAQIHPFVEQYNIWWDKHFKAAERCVAAGIAERRVRLVEEQGQIMVRIIRAHDLELERKHGIVIVADPAYPSMMRRHLALGTGSDVIEVS